MAANATRKQMPRDLGSLPDWALIDLRDVMQLTSISRTAIDKLLASGAFPLPTNGLTKKRRWKLGDVRRFCEAGRVE